MYLPANVIILAIMTGLKPVQYELQPSSVDEYGRAVDFECYCQYYGRPEYVIPLALINGGVLLLAIAETWQSRHLSTEFQESRGIFRALSSILLVLFVGIPGKLRSAVPRFRDRLTSHACILAPQSCFWCKGMPMQQCLLRVRSLSCLAH